MRGLCQDPDDFRPSNAAFNTFEYDVSPGISGCVCNPIAHWTRCELQRHSYDPAGCGRKSRIRPAPFPTENAVGRYFKNSAGVSIQIVGFAPTANNSCPVKRRGPQRTSRSRSERHPKRRLSSEQGRPHGSGDGQYGSRHPQNTPRS